MTPSKRLATALTLATLAGIPSLAAAGTTTKKAGGITITLEADGKQDNGGDVIHEFKLVASSSNRKDDKMVDLVIHLLDDQGDELSTCSWAVLVRALKTEKEDVQCHEPRDWASFELEITSVGPPRD